MQRVKKQPEIKIPEKAVQSHILQFLRAEGYTVWRNNSGAIRFTNSAGMLNRIQLGLQGSPDIIGWTKKGRFLGIEVKAKNGKQTDYQLRFEERAKKDQAIYILARSVNDVIRGLQEQEPGSISEDQMAWIENVSKARD